MESLQLSFFFFQAEDGIRDLYVTGVQTCALPICRGRADDVLLTPRVVGGVDDAAGRHLRLVDRRDRLRMPGQPGPHPGELRRVDRRDLHHGDMDIGLVVAELAAQRLGEPVDRVLAAAVGRLQRNAAGPERRPDLDDGAMVARPPRAISATRSPRWPNSRAAARPMPAL